MGYTHYTTQQRPFTDTEWAAIIMLVKQMLDKAPVGLIRGPQGTGKPIVTKTKISLNGNEIGDQGHETFQVLKDDPEPNFCKTAQKPYDAYVTAILCIIDKAAPGALEITSDGTREEWEPGLDLANTFVKDCQIPKGVRSWESKL